MLPAAQLALAGGGTEPLTWRSLRTARVQTVEAPANIVVGMLFGMVSLGSLVVLVMAAIAGQDWLTLAGLAAMGLGGLAWLALRRFRG